MNKYTQLLIIIFLLIPLATASVQIGYESAAVGRIVGESPEEMRQQLQQTNYNLREAEYFPDHTMYREISGAEISAILDNSFEGNLDDQSGIMGLYQGWYWDDVKNEIDDWNKNNLLIVEGSGEIDDEEITLLSEYGDQLSPQDINWPNIEVYHPLAFFNIDYAGLYLQFFYNILN